MRFVPTLVIAALVALPGLAASATLAPASEPASRVAGIMQHYDEATTTTIEVPSGSMLVGRVVDGSFVLDVVPDEGVTVPMGGSTPTTIECLNDVPTQYDPWYGWIVSVYPITPNLLAPAVSNVASLGMCDNSAWGGDTHTGPITLLQYRTAGDSGGTVYLYGSGLNGYGEYVIDCWPAGAGGGVGVGERWVTFLEVDNAICYVYEYGVDPSEYLTFNGYNYNWNMWTGTTYVAVN